MLDFDEKAAIYNLIPTSFTIHAVNGTTQVITVPKFQTNQQHDVIYPMINIGWESEGRPALGFKPTFLRPASTSPVAWDENVGTPVKFKVVQGNIIEEITFIATELEAYQLELYTGKDNGSTSSLKLSIINVSTGITEKQLLIDNQVIHNNAWTTIDLNFSTKLVETYTIKLEEAINDLDSTGIRIYQDFSGLTLYSIKRKRFVEVHGGPVTTDIIIQVHAKDQQGPPFVSGETLSSEIMRDIWTEIHKSLEALVSTVKMDGFAEPQSITEQVSGEYIYGQRLGFSVIYENNWEVEVPIVKEITVRKLELKL